MTIRNGCDCRCSGCVEADANGLLRCTPYDNGVTQLGASGGRCTPETAACQFRGVAVPKDRNTVVTVTDVGDIWRSTNMGINWTQTAIGTPLNALHFAKARGVIVGDGGLILRSTDSGETWAAPAVNPATGDLHCVRWSNGSVVMACGDGGTILRSDDFGITFNAQASGTTNTLRALWFTTSQQGYCVGDGGIVLRTIDGGTTWESLGGMTGDGRGVVARKKAPGALVEIVSVDAGRSYLWTVIGDTVVEYSVFEPLGTPTPPNIFRDGLIATGMTLTDCFGEDGYASYVFGSNTIVSPIDGILYPGWFCRLPHTASSGCLAAYHTPILAMAMQSDDRGWRCGESSDDGSTGASYENRDGNVSDFTVSDYAVGGGQSITLRNVTTDSDNGCDVPCIKTHLEWSQSSVPATSNADKWGTWTLFELNGGPQLSVVQGEKVDPPTIRCDYRVAALTRPNSATVCVRIMPYFKFTSTPGLLTGSIADVIYGPGTLMLTNAASHTDPTSQLWGYEEDWQYITFGSAVMQNFGCGPVIERPWEWNGLLIVRSPWWTTFGDWQNAYQEPSSPINNDWYAPPHNPRRPGDFTFGFALAVFGAETGDYTADVLIDNICLNWGKSSTPSGCSALNTTYQWNGTAWVDTASTCGFGTAPCNVGYTLDILNAAPAPSVGDVRHVPCSIP